MSRAYLNRSALTDLSWWHWALTVPLLAASLAGYRAPLAIAIAMCAAAVSYYWFQLRQIQPYPVQVRMVYLGLLAVGCLPWMEWLHWTQLTGTTAMVTVGYCPLIRLLSLIRPNRTEPLTGSLAWRAFVQQPCGGGLFQWPASSATISACGNCSI